MIAPINNDFCLQLRLKNLSNSFKGCWWRGTFSQGTSDVTPGMLTSSIDCSGDTSCGRSCCCWQSWHKSWETLVFSLRAFRTGLAMKFISILRLKLPVDLCLLSGDFFLLFNVICTTRLSPFFVVDEVFNKSILALDNWYSLKKVLSFYWLSNGNSLTLIVPWIIN